MQTIARLGESNQIVLVWVLGHQGITGNEKADRLAKLGIEIDLTDPTIDIPFATDKRIIRNRLSQERLVSWETTGGCPKH